MAEGKAKRFDPYRNFRFKVVIGGNQVAGLNKMSGLKKTTEGIDWWEGGDNFNPRRLPGKTKYEAITLERGLTDDKVFEDWANLVNQYMGNVMALENFRKNIQIQVCDMNGTPQIIFNIFDCWVSEFQAVPALDVSQNAVAIQSIKLEHEGFSRG
jgi:phage tail-like protein